MKCLNCGHNRPCSRGLCSRGGSSCYAIAYRAVGKGRVTWEELEAVGKAQRPISKERLNDLIYRACNGRAAVASSPR